MTHLIIKSKTFYFVAFLKKIKKYSTKSVIPLQNTIIQKDRMKKCSIPNKALQINNLGSDETIIAKNITHPRLVKDQLQKEQPSSFVPNSTEKKGFYLKGIYEDPEVCLALHQKTGIRFHLNKTVYCTLVSNSQKNLINSHAIIYQIWIYIMEQGNNPFNYYDVVRTVHSNYQLSVPYSFLRSFNMELVKLHKPILQNNSMLKDTLINSMKKELLHLSNRISNGGDFGTYWIDYLHASLNSMDLKTQNLFAAHICLTRFLQEFEKDGNTV